MGYETNAIFITPSQDNFTGYCAIEATLEMGKIAYEEIGKLMNESIPEDHKDHTELKELVETYKECNDLIYTSDGEYTEKVSKLKKEHRDIELEQFRVLRKKLDKQLPYIFATDGNTQHYADSYGDVLVPISLKKFKKALLADNGKHRSKNGGRGYRRFEIALRMVNSFMAKKYWPGEVKVILWGH